MIGHKCSSGGGKKRKVPEGSHGKADGLDMEERERKWKVGMGLFTEMEKRNAEMLRHAGGGLWVTGFLCLELLEGLKLQI